MFSGIPLAKADHLRNLLERGGESSTHSSHLAVDIPKIEGREFQKLRSELRGQHMSLQFDGTGRLGEAVNAVVRFVPEDFTLQHRLVMFRSSVRLKRRRITWRTVWLAAAMLRTASRNATLYFGDYPDKGTCGPSSG